MENNKKYAVFSMDVEDLADAGCLVMRGIAPDNDVSDGLDEYISILERHGIRATLFTLRTTAEKIEEKLKKYSDRGHSIAVHGYDHTPLNYLDAEEFKGAVRDTKEYLEALTGKEVTGYRAPFFSMDNEKLEVLKELGFKYDSSSHDFTKNYLKEKLIKGGFDLSEQEGFLSGASYKDGFFEFGLSCENILGCSYPVSGGGYVRLCPWPLVKNGLWRYIRKNDFYVFYLHPFELSQNRPKDIPGIPATEKHYLNGGINKYGKKIEKIINMLKREGYEFVTFDDLCEIKMHKEESPVL